MQKGNWGLVKMIPDTDGEFMAPFGTAKTIIRGKRICVTITGVGKNSNVPMEVRQALIRLPLDAVFTEQQVISGCGPDARDLLPEGCLLAYADEVISLLQSANLYYEAALLKGVLPNEWDVYVIEAGTFQLVPDKVEPRNPSGK